MPCSFLLSYEMQIQRKCTHYGVVMDIVACMDTTISSTSSILLQYPTPNALSLLWNNKQYNKNGTPSYPSGPIFNNVLIAI
jgi:hypothetical protein